ncbi:unnamed protein product [Thelazia callipaeda]|uniref:Mini-chromosome maintenance complex-binding protein n=1 Tax=Thelazia callipaeda TaxID=103827 RepID=A0A0N5D0V0_THECL|nr:unnamed protein product [Thelazia callipaeda]
MEMGSIYREDSCRNSEDLVHNEIDIYEEVDRIFFENVADYSENPCKLIEKLSKKFWNEFKTWKCLHTDQVKQNDLVRMRGMILNGVDTEFSLNGVVTVDSDGNTHVVCGILRDCIQCLNIEEIKGISHRYVYNVVPERGSAEWYTKTLSCKNHQKSVDAFLKDEKSKVSVKFYSSESELFSPNMVFDLYGIIDLNKIPDEECDFSSVSKSSLCEATLHVIHYEPVDCYSILSAVYPEVLDCPDVHARGIKATLDALERFLDSKIVAELLVSRFIVSRSAQPEKSVVNSLPYTLKNVCDSKTIIEMIKLFISKVHVIEMSEKMLEESWASYMRPDGCFEQGLLQVSDDTLIIIDETKLPINDLSLSKEGMKNFEIVSNFLLTGNMPFIFPYQTVEIESGATVFILSGEKCFLGEANMFTKEHCSIKLPKSYLVDMRFIQQYGVEHDSVLNLCRHALLSCRKNLGNIEIGKEIQELSIQEFLEMQHKNRNTERNSNRLHRMLMISKCLASLMGQNYVDQKCWTRAVELENSLHE